VKIGKHGFRVIGVMRERGTSGFANQDNQIYVPITTAQKLLLGINYVNFGRAKVKDNADIDHAIDDIKSILRDRHDLAIGQPNDFDVRSQKDAINVLLKVTNAIKFFLAAVAGIALLVGGIGIMNIMLVAVQERIREIGLRKAVGATKFDVTEQFLIETVIITSIAGILGIILGIFISYLVSFIMQSLGFDWNFSISLVSVFLSVIISSAIGFIFGLVPARRASKLDPIEALRYE
jgi:putative ABC transport system permease protein